MTDIEYEELKPFDIGMAHTAVPYIDFVRIAEEVHQRRYHVSSGEWRGYRWMVVSSPKATETFVAERP